MKYIAIVVAFMLSACATRHVGNMSAWYPDCYNKTHQEAMIARAEAVLGANDHAQRRQLRDLYWNLQKQCK